ncbi:MAG: hypothetical protein ACE5KM_13165 [Planctomycetaceae bacterium]
MSWSICLLMFAGIPAQPPVVNPDAHFDNYHRALREARLTGKPLLVVLNPGAESAVGGISMSAIRKTRERRELLENYVVVVIDASTRHGRIVHRAYERPRLPHVAVLDKRQALQLFTTSETLYGQRWTEILQTYRNGVRAVARRPAAYCST